MAFIPDEVQADPIHGAAKSESLLLNMAWMLIHFNRTGFVTLWTANLFKTVSTVSVGLSRQFKNCSVTLGLHSDSVP